MDTIQELKNGLTDLIVLKNEPTQEHCDTAYQTAKGLRRIAFEGIPVARAMGFVDKAIDWQLKAISEAIEEQTIADAKKEAWEILHPRRELTQEEKEEVERLEAVYVYCVMDDAYNTYQDSMRKAENIKAKIRDIMGIYDPMKIKV